MIHRRRMPAGLSGLAVLVGLAVLLALAVVVPVDPAEAASSPPVSLTLSDPRSGADGVTAHLVVTAPAALALAGLRVVLPTGTGVSAQRITVRLGRLSRSARAVVEAPSTLRVTLAKPLRLTTGQQLVAVLTGLANPPNGAHFNGRADLLTADGRPVAALTFPVTYAAADRCGTFRTPGWVASENSRAGHDWRIEPGPADIEGYADRVSTQCGENVTVKVSTTAPTFEVDAYRMGWYGGAGARLVWSSGPLVGEVQPEYVVHAPAHTVVAPWRPSVVLSITGGWPPGEYLLRLHSASDKARFIPLTIRDDGSTARIVVQHSVLTWQAYNAWGGYSLYRGPNADPATRAVTVSFDRPYAADGVTGFGDGQFLAMERPLVAFAEEKGMDVTYSTDVDLDARPALLTRHQELVLLTHDEYWTPLMRASVESALNHGVNLLSLGADAVYWKTALDTTARTPRRTVTVYRTPDLDPQWEVSPALVTNRWRDAPLPRPESVLLGGMYDCLNENGDGQVTSASSWVFARTGLHDLDTLGAVVAGENDRYWPSAAPTGLQILAHATFPCVAHDGIDSGWDMTYYTNAQRGGVLAVGTMGWICNLDASCPTHPEDHGLQAVVRQVTANVLAGFAAGPAGVKHPSVPNVAAVCARLGCVGSTGTPGGITETVTQG